MKPGNGGSEGGLRDPVEIQRAHDILGQVLCDPEIRKRIPPLHPMDALLLESACNALCWVLGHDHNQAFAENLADLEDILEAAGARLVDNGSPFTLDELFRARARRKCRERPS